MDKPANPTTNQRLNAALWTLNILNKEAAGFAGVHERTLYRWLSGESRCPESVATMFELLVRQRQPAKV